jgi:hypothetical protein
MLERPSLLALSAVLTIGGVAPGANNDGSAQARLGQRVNLGGPRVTVLKVLEDSRCPMQTLCVWAGRVRVKVRIANGTVTTVQELASDKPLVFRDGKLELLGVMPPRRAQSAIQPRDYRFTLKFSGER